MSAIALLPGVLALVVGITRGPARAFVDVYLPTLLLMPDYYRFIIAGLPDPTPNQAAILAVAALALLRRRAWSPSLLGGLVLVLCATMAYSEYRAKGYADAQNFLFDILGSMLLPYLLARALIEPSGLRVAFAKRMVQIMALQALLGLWEMRMVIPLVRRLLDPFFPGQGSWAPTGRYGFIRVSSSFGHAILAGIMFVSAYRLQRWLQWTGAWPGRLPGLGIPRARAYTALVLLGAIITLVRGPWLGGVVGGALLTIARARQRGRVAAATLALALLIGIPGGLAFWSYASAGRQAAETLSQETAAYRKELLESYASVALERPVWGWGRGLFPQVPGFDSTDNHFLLLALNHGLPTLLAFVALIAVAMIRLIHYGAQRARSDPSALLAFTLAGIYAVFTVSLVTVYHGMQTVQLFFLLTGWADGLLARAPAAARVHAPRFHAVLS